ncbi:MAG: ABC transporter substrate-binding protein [Thermodesulfobacteriota bacterium]
MKKKFWVVPVIIFLAVTVLFVAHNQAADQRPYKIGCIFSTTGPGALLGERMKTTVEMMAETINKKGGLDGHPVQLTIYDSASESTKAVTAANRLITQDQVDIVSGMGNMSGLSLAIKPIGNKFQVPMISNSGARAIVEPLEDSKWIFKSHLTDKEIIGRAFDWWKAKGITKVAMLSDTSGFGKSARDELKAQEPGSGVKVVAWEEFDMNATDLTAQLTRIRSADPEVILCWTVAPAGVVFMKQARQLGMKQTLMHGFGYVVPKYMQMAGEAAEGCVLVSLRYPVGPQLPDSDPCKKVILDYMAEHKAKYGQEPDVYGAEAYDGLLMAIKAFEMAKSLDKEKLRGALEKLSFVGACGVYKFSPQRHYGLTKDDAVVFEWRKGNWKLLMAAGTK